MRFAICEVGVSAGRSASSQAIRIHSHGTPQARELFEFLGVDSTWAPELSDRNVTRYDVKWGTLDRLVHRLPGKRFVGRVVSDETRARAKRALRRRNSRRPEFPAVLRRQLVDLYRDDIERTSQLIGRDLSAWTGR